MPKTVGGVKSQDLAFEGFLEATAKLLLTLSFSVLTIRDAFGFGLSNVVANLRYQII